MLVNQCYKMNKKLSMFRWFCMMDGDDIEDNTRKKCININLNNEEAIDDGGVSRELFDNVCANLCAETPILPILIPTPN